MLKIVFNSIFVKTWNRKAMCLFMFLKPRVENLCLCLLRPGTEKLCVYSCLLRPRIVKLCVCLSFAKV